jgi:hypothetical protein
MQLITQENEWVLGHGLGLGERGGWGMFEEWILRCGV